MIFPYLCKTFCVFILIMHILFCCTSQKNMLQKHSVHPLPLSAVAGWLSLLQFLEGVAGKEGGNIFQWGCSFYIKNQLKSEMFKNKKNLEAKMFFSAIAKNLNWEILTQNFFTFKR